MILCSNPLAQYRSHRAQIDAAIERVLASGRYILGEEVRAFESEFAAYIGVAHGIGVGSGTEALHVALRSCGIGRGDEVITVSHTAVATVSAIDLAGASPVLVDIEPENFTIAAVEAAVSPRTKAIIAVHLYGQPCDLDMVAAVARRHRLYLIEDCAQAHGAKFDGRRVGSVGDIGCFSFYPTKNLGAIGDGGMMVANDDALARRMRSLREYGWADRYTSVEPGWNSRLDELQAALLRVKLATLDADNARRQALAGRYDAAFADLPLVRPARRSGSTHVFHLYVVRSDDRDGLQAHLREQGIGALVHYPVPVHLQPAYLPRGLNPGPLPQTESTAREVLSLPMYPELETSEQDHVIDAVRAFFRGRLR
jgi:dTDP-4-amino-4,6-dideoxygalactose transaminase